MGFLAILGHQLGVLQFNTILTLLSSLHLGNSNSFRSSVPEIGINTKYVLIINHMGSCDIINHMGSHGVILGSKGRSKASRPKPDSKMRYLEVEV